MGSAIGLGHRCSVRPDAGEFTRTHVICNTTPNGFVIPMDDMYGIVNRPLVSKIARGDER